jgi:hypothetical protein
MPGPWLCLCLWVMLLTGDDIDAQKGEVVVLYMRRLTWSSILVDFQMQKDLYCAHPLSCRTVMGRLWDVSIVISLCDGFGTVVQPYYNRSTISSCPVGT